MDWRKKIHPENENDGCFQLNIDWIQKMNNAMVYIENHLEDEIDFSMAAQIACCSTYHFGRFFPFLAGVPLSEYIRRRRLTLAAFELQNSDEKVIDIALKYGYESPEAFARAFKNLHGVTPATAKEKGAQLKAYPPITFHISIKGDSEMDYRIEQKPAFKMFGKSKLVTTQGSQNFKVIPRFWAACRVDGTTDKIRKAAGISVDTPLHAAMYDCTADSHKYMIGYFAPEDGSPLDFTMLEIPACTWAVFPIAALDVDAAAQQSALLWKRIFTEWFTTSGYELAPNVPEFELHHRTNNGKFVTEIYIPITKEEGAV